MMLIKMKTADYEDLERVIKANHNYETAEVVLSAIVEGNKDYLDWISNVTR